MISLIFPIIGLIASLIFLLLITRKMKTEWLQQYAEYVSFHIENYEEMLNTAKQDQDLISFSSGLEIDRTDLHKQLIVQLSTSSISNEGLLLRGAIQHKDPETVHYAATTIHVLNERYEKQIDYLNKKFIQTKQREIIDELVSCYLKYIESGLLSEQQEQRVIKEFMSFISQVLVLFPEENIYRFHFGNLLFHQKQYDEATKQFHQLLRVDPAQPYGYIGLLEVYYEQKLWKDLYHLLDDITNKDIWHTLPRKYQLFAKQVFDISKKES